VDETAEHIGPFDMPNALDACGCRLRCGRGFRVDAAVRPELCCRANVLVQNT
jgi:hypothetical protein